MRKSNGGFPEDSVLTRRDGMKELSREGERRREMGDGHAFLEQHIYTYNVWS